MHLFILWVGFFGAWLLFAGPVYQAALELQEQSIDRQKMHDVAHEIGAPKKISNWWWLLPPVRYVMQSRQQQAYREAVFRALGPEELRIAVTFINKATGWMLVAGGAFLIATKETWELAEANEWPWWVFWALLPVMATLGALYTAASMARSRGVIHSLDD